MTSKTGQKNTFELAAKTLGYQSYSAFVRSGQWSSRAKEFYHLVQALRRFSSKRGRG